MRVFFVAVALGVPPGSFVQAADVTWESDEGDADIYRAPAPEISDYGGPPPAVAASDEEAVDYFYNALAPYGEWIRLGDLGWVWRPSDVSRDWRPYTDGRWVWTDEGWTWLSDREWGWAPFHYGRWLEDNDYGWVWVPGAQWAPAWVEWRYGDGWIGWAPLPPRIHVGIEAPWDKPTLIEREVIIPHRHYCFVEDRYLAEPDVARYILPPTRNLRLFRDTNDVTRYVVVNRRVVNRSIDAYSIERRIHHTIPRFRIVERDSPGAALVGQGRGHEVAIFRPFITGGHRHLGGPMSGQRGGRTRADYGEHRGEQPSHPSGSDFAPPMTRHETGHETGHEQPRRFFTLGPNREAAAPRPTGGSQEAAAPTTGQVPALPGYRRQGRAEARDIPDHPLPQLPRTVVAPRIAEPPAGRPAASMPGGSSDVEAERHRWEDLHRRYGGGYGGRDSGAGHREQPTGQQHAQPAVPPQPQPQVPSSVPGTAEPRGMPTVRAVPPAAAVIPRSMPGSAPAGGQPQGNLGGNLGGHRGEQSPEHRGAAISLGSLRGKPPTHGAQGSPDASPGTSLGSASAQPRSANSSSGHVTSSEYWRGGSAMDRGR